MIIHCPSTCSARTALPRLGEKIAEALRQELQRLDTRSQRLPLAIALPAAEEVIRQLKSCRAVESIAPAGSIRRWKDTTGDIDILVASTEPEEVIRAFTSLSVVKQVLGAGGTRASILNVADVQIDLRVAAEGRAQQLLELAVGGDRDDSGNGRHRWGVSHDSSTLRAGPGR